MVVVVMEEEEDEEGRRKEASVDVVGLSEHARNDTKGHSSQQIR